MEASEQLTKEEIEELREFLNACIYAPPDIPGRDVGKFYRWYLGLGE